MPEIPGELWQWLLAVASGAVILEKAVAVISARSVSMRQWWRSRWLPTVLEITRDERIDTLLNEFTPNGGSTMRDRVDEISNLLAQHIEESKTDRETLARHIADSAQHMQPHKGD